MGLTDRISDNDSDSSTSTSASNFVSFSSLVLLPISLSGVYTFLEKAAVLATLEGIFGGGSGLALVIAESLFVIGAITISLYAAIGVLIIMAFLVAISMRSIVAGLLGFLGVLYYGLGYLIGVLVFSELPTLVGFILGSTIVGWAVVAVAVAIGGTAVLVMLGLEL